MYDIGGFSLPFLICGSINTIFAILLILTIRSQDTRNRPEIKNMEDSNGQDYQNPGNDIKIHENKNNEKIHLLKEPSSNYEFEYVNNHTTFQNDLG